MSSAHSIMSSALGLLYPLAFVIAGVLVIVRFKTTPTGLLAGGSFFGMALRSLVYVIFEALSPRSGTESYVALTVVMTGVGSVLYIALTAGIAMIPASLRKLSLRAQPRPTTF